MKPGEEITIVAGANGQPELAAQPVASRPSFLHLVSAREAQDLRDALVEGKPPADLELKLSRLAGDSLIHRFVQQNSRLILALLLAAYDGRFREASPEILDRLLRVLAYVRK